jgi:hypothetical protein
MQRCQAAVGGTGRSSGGTLATALASLHAAAAAGVAPHAARYSGAAACAASSSAARANVQVRDAAAAHGCQQLELAGVAAAAGQGEAAQARQAPQGGRQRFRHGWELEQVRQVVQAQAPQALHLQQQWLKGTLDLR